MVDLRATTSGGEETVLAEASVENLRASLRGELLQSGDDGYEDSRTLFNIMIDKHPGLIVRCTGAADIMRAIDFARDNDLLLSTRGGGHNVTGSAVADGGIMLDLSGMKGVRVNPDARIVHAEGGLTWGELNDDLEAFGLAATGGFISTTGVGGLTLGGGLGWLVRKYGLACDNLLSVDIITADGRFLKASPDENQELFWGVRGGGGNFGVVSSFEFRVHPIETVLAGVVIHSIADAKDVLSDWRDYAATAPEEVTDGAMLMSAPPAPFLPEDVHGNPVLAIYGVYTGDMDTGEQVLQPLRAYGPPMADIFQPMPYTAAQVMADFAFPAGFHNYWKSSILDGVSDEAIDVILEFYAKRPSPQSAVVLEHNGDGAMNRVDASDTAFGHRDWSYNLLITAVWEDTARSDVSIAWAREFWEAMQPFTGGGVYVNYLDDEGEGRVKAAYAAETYERLVALKNEYDPTNLFQLNQNIRPTV